MVQVILLLSKIILLVSEDVEKKRVKNNICEKSAKALEIYVSATGRARPLDGSACTIDTIPVDKLELVYMR